MHGLNSWRLQSYFCLLFDWVSPSDAGMFICEGCLGDVTSGVNNLVGLLVNINRDIGGSTGNSAPIISGHVGGPRKGVADNIHGSSIEGSFNCLANG